MWAWFQLWLATHMPASTWAWAADRLPWTFCPTLNMVARTLLARSTDSSAPVLPVGPSSKVRPT